jgi:cobalt-zinc-cadmium efflux system protein
VHDHAHHGHAHFPSTPGQSSDSVARVLRLSLVITLAYVALLVVAGIRAHSLALLSEAGHNLSDFIALGLSWFAVYLESRPASATKTFGWRRAGVLAALANSASLVVVAFLIFYEAFRRLRNPGDVHAATVIWVAAAGFIMNGIIAIMLYRTSRDVNMRSAFLHQFGDALSTAAVIAGGVAILMTGQHWIDAALSIGIGALILWSSFGILRETLNILLEGTPRGVSLAKVEAAILAVPGVNYVHDLHVWSIGSETHALSCHIGIEDIPLSACESILRDVNAKLLHDFGLGHTTIQFEHLECNVADGCVMPAVESHSHGHSH